MQLRRLLQIVLLVVLAVPCTLGIPLWLMATWIGCAWGTLVLTGMMGSWASYRLGWIAYAAVAAWLAQRGLVQTLELERNAAWLAVSALLSAGWLIGKVTTLSGAADERMNTDILRWPQISLWDLASLTTCVAFFCTLIPQIEDGFHLVCQLAPALLGGLLLSLTAAQWAWRDRWSLSSLVAALVVVIVALLMIVPYSVWDSTAIVALISWMIVGPIGVIAAQGTLVLAYLAATRG